VAIGGYANVHAVESSLPTDGMYGMGVLGIVEVMNIMGKQRSIALRLWLGCLGVIPWVFLPRSVQQRTVRCSVNYIPGSEMDAKGEREEHKFR
jgi:hypothetical protein